ncbi:histidine kinase [Chitinophaga horti]|uniref:Histidine kinase n=1 Tax=Chitinophaga horti TaxID=2920382 RepID=A0ABY6IYB3_9BACT|nr:histidine kinase [Chitinophaga horti]UYQ92376.1 histidine kinase [Chitinophaga horti]
MSTKHRLLLLTGCLFCLGATGQRKTRPTAATYISLGTTQLSFQTDYSTLEATHHANEFRLHVYTGDVLIQAINLDSLIVGPQGGQFMKLATRSAFGQLQARLFKNDSLLQDWAPLSALPAYIDSNTMYKYNRGEPGRGRQLANIKLDNSDSLLLELRNNSGASLLRVTITKGAWDTQPFIQSMSIAPPGADLYASRNSVTKRFYKSKENTFYQGWPGDGLTLHHQVMVPGVSLSLLFRQRGVRGDSIFEYRLWRNDTHRGWQRSDEIIHTDPLEAGTSYILEVRFADQPTRRSIYSFKVPAAWYQTWWVRALAALLLATLLLLIFGWMRLRLMRRKAERYRLETQALYAQMNPHFLFNALSTIQGLMNDGQTTKANHYLTGFASLLRGTIQMGNRTTVPLVTELKNLEHYIRLEQMRFNFNYIYTIDETIPTNDLEVPPLLAQPLIENAVKHGLAARREDGLLVIHIYRKKNDFLMSIHDNGEGFDAQAATGGYGLRLTRERISLFNKQSQSQQLLLTFTSGETGTTMIIRYKNWLHD